MERRRPDPIRKSFISTFCKAELGSVNLRRRFPHTPTETGTILELSIAHSALHADAFSSSSARVGTGIV